MFGSKQPEAAQDQDPLPHDQSDEEADDQDPPPAPQAEPTGMSTSAKIATGVIVAGVVAAGAGAALDLPEASGASSQESSPISRPDEHGEAAQLIAHALRTGNTLLEDDPMMAPSMEREFVLPNSSREVSPSNDHDSAEFSPVEAQADDDDQIVEDEVSQDEIVEAAVQVEESADESVDEQTQLEKVEEAVKEVLDELAELKKEFKALTKENEGHAKVVDANEKLKKEIASLQEQLRDSKIGSEFLCGISFGWKNQQNLQNRIGILIFY